MKTFKEFTKKEIIGHAISIAGIVVTVVFIAKPDNVINNLYENKYFVPVSGLVSEIKQAVSSEEKEKQNAKIAYSTSSVASVPVVKEVAKVEKKEPVKVEVKEEQVATSSVSKVETVAEVKENPFEIVKWNISFDKERTENIVAKEWNIKIYVEAIHRQGSLASVTKCDYYTRKDGKTKNSAEGTIDKEMNVSYFPLRAYADEDLQVRTFVKCHAFTNDGGKITWGESEWIEVK